MRETSSLSSILEHVATRSARRGLDLVHAFSTAWYNDRLPAEARRLPDFDRPALGLLIANTRTLWPVVKAALAADVALARAADPIDSYVELSTSEALAGIEQRSIVLFSHQNRTEPLPIQRIAQAAGFARLAPSHLSIHAVHGPWIALRAVVVLDVDGPSGPPPEPFDPCTPCSKPCLVALERALELTSQRVDALSVAQSFRAWLSVRDACPVGKDKRYSDEQIEYHYTKARSLLEDDRK